MIFLIIQYAWSPRNTLFWLSESTSYTSTQIGRLSKQPSHQKAELWAQTAWAKSLSDFKSPCCHCQWAGEMLILIRICSSLPPVGYVRNCMYMRRWLRKERPLFLRSVELGNSIPGAEDQMCYQLTTRLHLWKGTAVWCHLYLVWTTPSYHHPLLICRFIITGSFWPTILTFNCFSPTGTKQCEPLAQYQWQRSIIGFIAWSLPLVLNFNKAMLRKLRNIRKKRLQEPKPLC